MGTNQDVQVLINNLMSLDPRFNLVRRAFMISILHTIDGYSTQQLQRLNNTTGILGPQHLEMVFRCQECHINFTRHSEYCSHKIAIHLPDEFLSADEQQRYGNLQRRPYQLPESPSLPSQFDYKQERTFSITLQED